MKKLAILLGLIGPFVGWAGDYQWKGGASGQWSEPSNWNPAGTPGAGDAAIFAASVEITDGFAVGAGTLTVNVAADKELSLKGVVSGAGALAKTGGGAISLYGDNTFAGGFSAGDAAGAKVTISYHGSSYAANSSGGLVGIWHSNALGSGAATVNASLYVAGGLAVTTAVTKGWGDGPLIIRGSGDVSFEKAFTAAASLAISGSGSSNTLRFRKPFVASVANVWISHSGGGMNLVFEDNCTGAVALSLADGSADFYGTENVFSTLRVATPTRFHKENSLTAAAVSFTKSGGWLDLCGCDQTVDAPVSDSDGLSNYGVRSDTLAQLKLVGNNARLDGFRGVFSGCAGFHWSRGGYSPAFDGGIHTTHGVFSVEGTSSITLKNGASFTALGKLDLQQSNGTISMTSTSGDLVVNELVCAYQWCGIRFADGGGKIRCRTFNYNGADMPDGTYKKDGSSGYVAPVADPNGGIIVDSKMANRFVGATGGDWSDADNWWFGAAPAAGEPAVLDGVGVRLTDATPVLGNVTLKGATLTMSGWDTALNAADVVLSAGSTVTTPGAFAADADKSRVLISCANLMVASGASIDVNKKGWSCGLPSGTATKANGFGPGAGTLDFGAAHGGPGGKNPDANEGSTARPAVYGSAAEPVEPGSGGYQDLGTTGNVNTGTHGGGAVRIVATGTVTVNGSILANGGSVLSAGTSNLSDRRDTAGSGGSVWITCAKFAGNGGVIEANGGDGSEPCFPKWTWRTKNLAKPAGGGRIAIVYGDGQQAGDLVGMTISARAGLYTGTSGYFTGSTTQSGKALPLADQSKFRNNAELGSIWFSDGKLVTATLGSGLSGQVVNPVGYATEDDVVFTDGWVRFGGEGVAVSVGGDLTVSGDIARLEIGGGTYTVCDQAVSMAGISAGATTVSLTVGGNLLVGDGARLDIRSAETNLTSTFGATVAVDGDFTVGAKATVAPWSDLFTGGSVSFAVGGGFTVAEEGVFTADGLGFAAQGATGDPAFGPGRGSLTAAGGYGGKGGIGYNKGAQMTGSAAAPYGDEQHPMLAGSGAGFYSYGFGGNGGGVVYVTAQGDILVNGRVSANGAQGVGADEDWNWKYSAWQPSGSGGSVYLYGKTFSGTGVIQANGGDGRQLILSDTGLQAVGRGGGGRVAIWAGATSGERLKVRKASSVAELSGGFSGSCQATTGAVSFRYDASEETKTAATPACTAGQAGTVCFCTVKERQGVLLIVR